MAIGRLKDGVPLNEAQHSVNIIANKTYSNGVHGVLLKNLYDNEIGDIKKPLILLWVSVFGVFIIASINWTTMAISFWDAKKEELVIKMSLGASSNRVVAVILLECFIWLMISALIGLLLAYCILRIVVPYISNVLNNIVNVPGIDRIGIDLGVYAFTLLLICFCGLVFAILIVFKIRNLNLLDTLQNSHTTGGGIKSSRLRRSLLTIEILFAVAFVMVGVSLSRSTASLLSIKGVDEENITIMPINLPLGGSDGYTWNKAEYFYRHIIDAINQLPQVESVSVTTALPIAYNWYNAFMSNNRFDKSEISDNRIITPEYFRTIGMQLKTGRYFTDADTLQSNRVVIINDRIKERYWPDENPIGEQISMDGYWREIIGVVNNVDSNLRADRMELYFPISQWGFNII
jgi:hypothetical protein